jgi:type I restriction enzyme S subunit
MLATKTNTMLVPALRFKEFEGEWGKAKDSIQIVAGNAYKLTDYSESGVILIQGLNISPGRLNIKAPYYIPELLNTKHVLINKGDILLGLNRPVTNGELKVCVYNSNTKAFLYQRAGKLQFNFESIVPMFLYQVLRSDFFLKEITIELIGSDQPYIRSNLFQMVKLLFPSLPEQQKIASFLSAVDEKINQLTKKSTLLTQYKKGVMQKLFSQELRFKQEDGSDFPEWEEKKMNDIFDRVKEKNIENNLNVLTISAQQGLINQKEYFNRPISASNVTGYYLLKKGDFAYNKSYSKGYPMGAIKRLNNYPKGVVSTLYICFSLKNGNDSDFYEEFLEFGGINRGLHIIAQEGARNHGLLNMSVIEFFRDIDIPKPQLEEQIKIGKYIKSINSKLVQVNTLIEKAKAFKKGLLQQMFV